MRRDEATKLAREIARKDGVEMALTHSPYDGDERDPLRQYGCIPVRALKIFTHDIHVATLRAFTGEEVSP